MSAYPGLANQTIVVTGAAGGQGLREALLLAEHGARVIATDLHSEAPTEYVERGITYAQLDVTREADWRSLTDLLAARLDTAPLKGLINNAGTTHRSRLGEIERTAWDRVFAVNVTGAMLGMQHLVPFMGAGSSIVNVGSIAGLTAHYPVAYTSSKWALRGLTHVAATEFGPRGIRVNIIHPGFIETEMTAKAPELMRATQLELTPLERIGAADEVAHVAAFLLSDAAAYVTGAEIPVDGGYSSSAGAALLSGRLAAASPLVPPSPGAPRP